MSKLRIKVSGCMRSMAGAEVFCAIRSYLGSAARHGIGALDALTQAAQGDPLDPRADLTEKPRPPNRYRVHTQNYQLRQTYPVTVEGEQNGRRFPAPRSRRPWHR